MEGKRDTLDLPRAWLFFGGVARNNQTPRQYVYRFFRKPIYIHLIIILTEISMLFPLKFVAANIFMAGVTAGAVGGAAAVFVLSDQQRRDKLKDCADKLRENCKVKWDSTAKAPTN